MGNGIVEEGETEKEKTKEKKTDYERRKGKRTITSSEFKEENREKKHRRRTKIMKGEKKGAKK